MLAIPPPIHSTMTVSAVASSEPSPAFAAAVGSVTFAGEEHLARYDSSAWAERGFCTRCGTHLFYLLKEADRYVMWAGAFEDSSPFRVAGEIFIDEKPEGYALAGDHPRQTGEEFLRSQSS